MLKVKSFLLALCLSPLSLAAFQLPVSAQSQGAAGTFSGAGSNGNFIYTNPTPGGSFSIRDFPGGQAILSAFVATTITFISTAPINPISNASFASLGNLITGTSSNAQSFTTRTGTIDTGSATVTPNRTTGSYTVQGTSPSTLNGTVVAPTSSRQGSVTVNGILVTIPGAQGRFASNIPAGTQAAIAVILAGGSADQAAAAAKIALVTGDAALAVRLIANLGGILSNPNGTFSYNPLDLNLYASLLKSKSFDSGKELRLAQTEGRKLNVSRLALAISAYNEIIDTSSPEVLTALSKDETFIEIGKVLSKLRDIAAI